MKYKEKIEKLDLIEKEIETFGNTMIDGAINNKEYFKSKYKICWFLKESYSDENQSQYYRNFFNAEDLYEDFFKEVARPTWHPIIYISYSILNGFKSWNELNYIRDDTKMCNVINNISIINANKNYSATGTYTLDKNLEKGFNKFKDIIKKQIDLLDPDILIFGNTFYLYKDFLEINEEDKIDDFSIEGLINVYYKNNKIFLDVFHPASRKKNYVDSIINACNFLINKNFSN